ncbi:hypothetical protein BDP55DRAFT_268642 [Colletotrichum godetiae]|uniref:Uncharacterized protein n=1 Tax=Colletotrichum godetiae TaxID=1209918 RepID=A0AAJ0AXW7_9PEZI|nr:uncharacterized protein BDP55DRAFT_268642 [Colletotrichum godetiae]KAK1691592.1 hypothetical protein BDP55DRAFT_268642 [Colletotrichum godetiae]
MFENKCETLQSCGTRSRSNAGLHEPWPGRRFGMDNLFRRSLAVTRPRQVAEDEAVSADPGGFSSLSGRSVLILQVGRRSAWVDPTRCRRIAPGIPQRAVFSSDAVRLKKPPRHPVCQLTLLAVYCICLPQTDEQETSCGHSAFPISLAIVVWMAESANKTCSTDNCTLRLHGARFVPFSALVSGRFCGLSLFGSDLWMNRRSMKTLNYPFDRHPQRKTQD